MCKLFKSENGEAIVLITLSITILLGLLAFVIDAGQLYIEKSRMQKALDAAALAGALELPEQPNKAISEAEQTLRMNEVAPAIANISINSTYTEIKIQSSKTVSFVFAPVIGIQIGNVHASSIVRLNPLTSGKGAVPLGVDSSIELSFETSVVLKAGESTVGNFGALALSGKGGNDYETDLKFGFQDILSVGEVLETKTGNMAGPTKKAVDYRISIASTGQSYRNYPPNSPLVVLVPVYEPILIESNQVKKVKVVGFASFFIEKVASTSEGTEVTGRFIKKTLAGTGSSTQINYGTFGYRLVKN
jgi:Flp pilus assembly protein TadG